MIRFNPTLTAVMYMKFGMGVKEACDEAIKEILEYYPTVSGALVCMDYLGNHAAANYGSSSYTPFHYTVRDSSMNESIIIASQPLNWTSNRSYVVNIALGIYFFLKHIFS